MLLLTGQYEHVIDSKGRVLISNKLRACIDAEEHGSNFYLVLGANKILCLYPEKYFERLVLAVAPSAAAPDEAVSFERMYFAMANRLEPDRQGRLLLAERQRHEAGLKDNVTLVGVRDHIELWNTGQWRQYTTGHMPQYQSLMAKARQVVLQKYDQELQTAQWRQRQ